MKIKFYIWLMGVAGTLSAWAWRKHVKILRSKRPKTFHELAMEGYEEEKRMLENEEN